MAEKKSNIQSSGRRNIGSHAELENLTPPPLLYDSDKESEEEIAAVVYFFAFLLQS